MDADDRYFLPISALNAYCYCPHRAYLEYALGEWADNRLTLEGTLGHRRSHTPGAERRGEVVRTGCNSAPRPSAWKPNWVLPNPKAISGP